MYSSGHRKIFDFDAQLGLGSCKSENYQTFLDGGLVLFLA